MSEMQEIVNWLIEYAEKPVDPELIDLAERRDLSVKDLLTLGHAAALTAFTVKIREMLKAREAA